MRRSTGDPSEQRLEPGRVVAGKYHLNQLLGVGGMATVWSATNVFTERQFAIKFLLPNVARTEEASRRFLMEAKASARIDHPNIIEVIDVGQTEDGSLFLVMELLTGISLEAAIAQQQIPKIRLYDFFVIMLEVARALSAAHASGVIHRDLKPTNVFLSRDRQGMIVPKLLDFGISKFCEDEGIESLTVEGTILGSPNYMSPEQAQGSRSIDGRTDIFSFGSILFEALVGYRCFDASNFNALLIAVATKQPRSIDRCAPHLPEAVRSLVRECLAVDRNRRIASFDEVASRLENLLPRLERDPACIATPLQQPPISEEMPPPSSVASQRDAPPPHRIGYYSIGLVVTFAALVALVVWTSFGREPQAVSASRSAASAANAMGATGATTGATAAAPSLSTAWSAPNAVRTAADPPVVNVESLPSAVRPPSPVRSGKRKAVGRLLVASADVPCALFVDGAARGVAGVAGVTPLTLDVAVGAHRLRCEAQNVGARIADVSVTEASAIKVTFHFQ